ncbi:hypothetical protein PsorP6_009920 [Peronosclerospora sorghi]|uniref:Uncharacterized protein n=1 Tax=Peronosclerospora sorghi TaxID=230839 RepID=A0ACC0VWQ7_9STRA|nr:hypothetical protein PsorP6_009920 [Peronosclerospora sorghi]
MALDSLYGVAATNDTLPAIFKAVDGRAKVYLDGAVRRGTDLFKSLALVTRAVFLGRPILFGLTHSVSGVYYRLIQLIVLRLSFHAFSGLSLCCPSYINNEINSLRER